LLNNQAGIADKCKARTAMIITGQAGWIDSDAGADFLKNTQKAPFSSPFIKSDSFKSCWHIDSHLF